MNKNLKDVILSYDRQVPRYTSYPTAPHFKVDETVTQTYAQWLSELSESASLSLYLHVPFCAKMCWYCGCHTKVTQRYAPVEDYAHLMMREIDILADHLPKGNHIRNIHFGGGTPSMLRATDFELILNRIREKITIDNDADIAVEVDPRGLTEGRAATYAKAGVNRISLGVQDFNDKVLKAVNREQPYELSIAAVDMFRKHGINKFNFDLLYGLPHQTVEGMVDTIGKALALSPDRISLFGYAHVPWMKKHMKLIDEGTLPDNSLRYDLFETGAKLLQQAGYTAIGIDHFAKADDPMVTALRENRLHRNFQGYTVDETDALLGIGASSIGKLPQGYIQNAVDMPHYQEAILDTSLSARKVCPIDDEDRLRADVIEQLMCYFTADIAALCKKYGFTENHLDECLDSIRENIDSVFYTLNDNRVLSLNAETRQMVRIICAEFDAYLAKVTDKPRHAKAI